MNLSLFFTGLVSLSTLLLLFSQSRSLIASLKIQAYQHIVSSQIEVDKLFLIHPDLRPFLYGDADLPHTDSDLGIRARVVLDIALNVIDSTHQQRHLIPKLMLPSWLHYASETTSRPAVKQFLGEHPNWYPFAISGEYDRLLAEIKS